MKIFKQFIKYFLPLIGILWILLAPKIPCAPYLEDKEMLLLLERAKQKDLEALNSLTGFLFFREDRANGLLA